MRPLRYLNGRTLSPVPAEAGQNFFGLRDFEAIESIGPFLAGRILHGLLASWRFLWTGAFGTVVDVSICRVPTLASGARKSRTIVEGIGVCRAHLGVKAGRFLE